MRIWVSFATLLLISSPAFSQNQATEPPKPTLVAAWLSSGLLVYDLPSSPDIPDPMAAASFLPRPYIDGFIQPALSQVVCVGTVTGFSCLTAIEPIQIQRILGTDANGQHILSLAMENGGNVGQPSSPAAIFARPQTTCPYPKLDGSTEMVPVGDSRQGLIPFNKVAGDNYLATRKALFRRNGFRVEWQLMSTGAFVTFDCVGVPQ